MIRSNPTAIPLRASDLKLLQAELDKRRPAPPPKPQEPATGATVPGSAVKGKAHGDGPNPRGGEAFNALDERRRERQGQNVAERIGL